MKYLISKIKDRLLSTKQDKAMKILSLSDQDLNLIIHAKDLKAPSLLYVYGPFTLLMSLPNGKQTKMLFDTIQELKAFKKGLTAGLKFGGGGALDIDDSMEKLATHQVSDKVN